MWQYNPVEEMRRRRRVMPKKSLLFPAIAIFTAFSMVLNGCSIIKVVKGSNSTPPVSAVGVTGSIKTGSTVTLSDTKIESTGGTITVNKTGDLLNGLKITVPTGAYLTGKQFKISYAPVDSHTFGNAFNPITPLITVDNGGQYASDIIEVKVPVKVPAGSFAMGFMYDPASKKLEGMTTISQDSDSITLATKHFSSFLISSITDALLQKEIDSGFRPGVDDWQMDNAGSYISDGGNCSGMSVSAMWYYVTRPDGPGIILYNRYDNNGNKPATPGFWLDDSLAYRFVSVNQYDYEHGAYNTWLYTKIDSLTGYNDELNWKLFAYSMQLTGEPQYVSVSGNKGGHAMIVYRIGNGKLYIADPNFHGDSERRIIYYNGVFAPYESGDSVYEQFGYMSKTVVNDWSEVARHWAELKNKSIGNDKFPQYTLQYAEGPSGGLHELKDGVVVSDQQLTIFRDGADPSRVFRDGAELPTIQYSFDLKPGNNLLGILITKKAGTIDCYVDFQYVNVIYTTLTLKPAIQEAWPGKTITFDLELTEAAPKGAKFEWWVDGVLKKSGYDFGIDVSFPDVGTHTIMAKVVDAAGKVLMQAQGTAVIKALTTTAFTGNNLTALQKMKTFTGVFQGQCNIKEKTAPVYFSVSMWDWYGVNTPINITWSGASFSGTSTSPVDGGTQNSTVSGTVSGDGKTLTSFTFTYSRKSNYTSTSQGVGYALVRDDSINVQLRNMPIYDLVFESGSSSNFDFVKYGPEVKSYLVKYEQHMLTINSGKVSSETTYLSDTINWDGTGLQDRPTLGLHFK
jgi:hypothetical protein